MAFNFLGTLSKEQLNELRNFLSAQLEDIEEQVNTLRVEIDNLKRTRNDIYLADTNFGGNIIDTIGSIETELPDLVRIPKQNDANSARIMEKVKKPFLQNIKYKRERLEYKIKKITDAIEQNNEMIDLKAIAKTQTLELLSQIDSMFNYDNKNHLFQTTDEMRNFKMGIK